jgi:predicted small lipoprotein YifL
MRARILILLAALSLLAATAGCGNKGGLYLPESKPVPTPPVKPVPAAKPAAPAPADAPAAEKPQ